MEMKIQEEFIELFNTLVDSGVTFYYGDESIAHGEITNLEFKTSNSINIEINGFDIENIGIDEFIENHSKEGANYHSWETIRKFDEKLRELNS